MLTFAKNSGSVTRERGKNQPIADHCIPSNNPRKNCETCFRSSSFLVSKVVNVLTLLSLFCSPAFQEQRLLQAVQSGIVQRIKQALQWLKQLNSSKDMGKGSKGRPKGTKKMAITGSHGQIQQETRPSGDGAVISKRVLQILHQRFSSNQNVVHICCSNPSYAEDQQADVMSLLQGSSKLL